MLIMDLTLNDVIYNVDGMIPTFCEIMSSQILQIYYALDVFKDVNFNFFVNKLQEIFR